MWSVSWSEQALKKLAKLDVKTVQRIDVWVKRMSRQENPRSNGVALQGKKYKGLWRYRVGDYRLICQITDSEFVILVLEIGHRSSIYL
ncbi:MAG: type II toxin-antitoxin system RelE/ParE family toxin [Clostridiales Family XIII bacterium]|jgi:mRNA interferase RelE/StbE|nr:type II toxin-antitoxin system RelE/ParE family toxin [Clostridiales Family XIII bacterium]